MDTAKLNIYFLSHRSIRYLQKTPLFPSENQQKMF